MVPSLRWLLGASHPNATLTAAYRADSLLQTLAYVSYTVFFLYPVYVVTFVINSLWCTDIANHAVKALRDTPLPPPTRRQWWGVGFLQGTLNRLFKGQEGRNEGPTRGGEATESLYPKIESVPSVPASQVSGSDSGSGSSPLEAKLQPLGERVFALLMLTGFSAQMALLGCIPVVGQPITFWLLSWLYGYYCFDYRWGFDGWTLDQRLLYFERNWPFFAGFGECCWSKSRLREGGGEGKDSDTDDLLTCRHTVCGSHILSPHARERRRGVHPVPLGEYADHSGR